MANDADRIMRSVIDRLNRATPREELTQAHIREALQTREGWLRCSVHAFEEWMREPERRTRMATRRAEKREKKRTCAKAGSMNRRIIYTEEIPAVALFGTHFPPVEHMYHATKGWRRRTDGIAHVEPVRLVEAKGGG